jgi:hypothetical protein
MVELDEVFAASGVDIQSLKANDMGKMLAALVVWVRQKAGEQVTFDEVYRTLTTAQIRTSKVDPTAPASTG